MKRRILSAILAAAMLSVGGTAYASEGRALKHVYADSIQEMSRLLAPSTPDEGFVEAVVDISENTITVDGKETELKTVFSVSGEEEKKIFASADSALRYFDKTTYQAEKLDHDKVIITAPYQCCRIVVFDDQLAEDYGASSIVTLNRYQENVLIYDTPEETEQAYQRLREVYSEEDCWCEKKYLLSEINAWGTADMGFDAAKGSAYFDQTGTDRITETVTVAVIDSGADLTHEVFKGRSISPASYDFVEGTRRIKDDYGHGTAVSGTIIQSTPDNVELMILKVSKGNTQSLNGIAVLAAIQYAAEQDVDVINMSFGEEGRSDEYDRQFKELNRRGTVLVTAAGNEAMDVSRSSPANSSYTIAVSAVDERHRLTDFSNYGSLLDFCAPGEDLLLPDLGGRYEYTSGTSFSSPYVAAAAAYVRLIYPDSTPQEVYDQLKKYSVDLGTKGKDRSFGWGMPMMEDYVAQEYHPAASVHKWETMPSDEGRNGFRCPYCNEELDLPAACGENVSWTWDNGTLTLSGSGKMLECDPMEAPWAPLAEDTKTLLLKKDVVSLSDETLRGLTGLLSISLENGGHFSTDGVFLYSQNGEELYLTAKNTDSTLIMQAKRIHPYAFERCTRLNTLFLSGEKLSLDDHALSGCRKLTKVIAWGRPVSVSGSAADGLSLELLTERKYSQWDGVWNHMGGTVSHSSYYHDAKDWIVDYQKDWDYDANPIRPEVKVEAGDVEPQYTLEYPDELASGSCRILIQSEGIYFTGSATHTYYIHGNVQELNVSVPNTKLKVGEMTSISATSYGELTFQSSAPSVATVSSGGLVTAVAPGTAVITIRAEAVGSYEVATETVTITVTGTVPSTTPTKAPAAPKISSLTAVGTQMTLKWGKVSGAESYVVYRKIGSGSWTKVKIVKTTSLTETVKAANGISVQYKLYSAAGSKYSGYSAAKSTVVLTKPSLKSAEAGKKKLSVSWSKNKYAAGYQVQCSMDAKFSSNVKTITVKSAKTVKKTLSSLKGGKKYYVRVRAYKNGSYSPWSAVKSAKVKK